MRCALSLWRGDVRIGDARVAESDPLATAKDIVVRVSQIGWVSLCRARSTRRLDDVLVRNRNAMRRTCVTNHSPTFSIQVSAFDSQTGFLLPRGLTCNDVS